MSVTMSIRKFAVLLVAFAVCGVTLAGIGAWRATFSENDVYFVDDDGKSTGGGSLTLLSHRACGPVFTASLPAWSVIERMSMQEQTKDDVMRCLTPRIEENGFMSVYDDKVSFAVSEEGEVAVATAKGCLTDRADVPMKDGGFGLQWTMTVYDVRATATCASPATLVLPVVAEADSVVSVNGKTAEVSRKGATVLLTANRPFAWTRTMRKDALAFSPQTGFLAAYLTVPVVPGEKTEVTVEVVPASALATLDAQGGRAFAVKPDRRIPDLLATFAGEKVTDVATWERVRRPELKDFFERNVYGKRPVERPEGLAFRDLHPPQSVYGGLGLRRTVEISWPGRYKPGKFNTTLYLPAKAKGSVPAFAYLSLGKLEPDVLRHEVWAVSNLLVRGIACAAYVYKDVAPDWKGEPHDGFASGVYACFEKPNERTGESWGAISAWAWGLSRVMDFLETVPDIDPKRVRTVGLSRGGKTALWAAATDERFAGACASGSGCCGAGMNAIFLPCEDLRRIQSRFPYWFCGNFAKIARSSDQLYPGYDQHQMLALIAPRHLYVSAALHDTPRFGDFEGVRWSAPAWALYGLPTLGDAVFPAIEKPIHSEGQSYHVRHGVHDLTFDDWAFYADDFNRQKE